MMKVRLVLYQLGFFREVEYGTGRESEVIKKHTKIRLASAWGQIGLFSHG